MVTQSSNADIANWGLEFDERMCAIMWVRRAGLAACAEISVFADSTLVTITLDVAWCSIARIAKRSVTVDTAMACLVAVESGKCCMII
jgi:hypothetical protein